jgi:hypothetical protein
MRGPKFGRSGAFYSIEVKRIESISQEGENLGQEFRQFG